MGDFNVALQWSREIVDFRKAQIPKVLKMEKELLDLEFQRLIEWGNRLVGSGSTRDDVPQKKLPDLPEIKPWRPPYDVNQLCAEINDMRKMCEHFRSSRG